MHAIPDFYGSTAGRADRRMIRYHAQFQDYAAAFRSLKAPKRYAAFKAATLQDLAAGGAVMASFGNSVTPSSSLAGLIAAQRSFKAEARPIEKRVNRRFDAHGLYRCGSQF
jgi:hypothetical protein